MYNIVYATKYDIQDIKEGSLYNPLNPSVRVFSTFDQNFYLKKEGSIKKLL